MNKKLFGLTSLLLVFAALFSSISYASSFDISINRVNVNGQVVSESSSNLVNEANVYSVNVEFTAVQALDNGHAEAILRGRQSSDVVSDATGTFNLLKGQNSVVVLNLILTDGLRRENDFDLTVKVVDVKGNSEIKTYGIKTKRTISKGNLDVSVDRVRVNNQVVAESRTNFIDHSNDFDVLVEFTALEDLVNAHVEATLRDLTSNNVVADASSNFNLARDLSSSQLLKLTLLDKMKQSNAFELTVKMIDADGNSIQKVYGIRMRDGNGAISGTGGRALDVSIDSVEIESKSIAENENNFVIIREGLNKLNIRARLTSLENVKDAHVDAILSFENGDVVSDATTTFDISKDENIVKSLDIPLIGRFEQNSFKLKIRVVDADGFTEEKVYGLKISQKKFPFVISSISLNPDSNAEAGKALVATLSFKNSGVVPLDGINAKVSIPELGISATKFVGEIKNSGLPEVKEDFVLKILDNVQTGTYTVRAEITSQFGSESEVKEIPVFIVGKSEQQNQIVNDKLLINVPILSQDIKNDGSEVIYQLILKNEGPDANSYTLLLDGASWANLRLAESNAFVIQPKESKTISVYASSKGNAIGEQIFLATIKSNGRVLKQIPFKGNVIGAKGLGAQLMNLLEIFLIGFVVLLAAVGLFFGIRRYIQGNNSEEMSEAEGETYY